MDITITPTSANPTPKSPEQHADHTESPTATATPTRIHPSSKPLSFTNGVLKRQNLHQHNHDQQLAIPSVVGVVSYKECLKNHAAALGGHALDGCGEFMPSPTADKTNPTSLKCAACGCHRNFHRREPEDPLPLPPPPNTATHVIEYQPHHRHHPLPPAQPQPQQPAGLRSRNSVSPPPISSYYPSAPHMLLALSGGMSAQPEHVGGAVVTPSPISRKRFRTKFSQIQKEKMHQFAEKVGWKMQKRDDDLVHEFCNEIGVEKGVFKVWMHNNKNTYGKKDNGAAAAATAIGMITTNSTHHDDHNHNNVFSSNNDDNNNNNDNGSKNVNQYQNDNVGHVGTNGSSSSS